MYIFARKDTKAILDVCEAVSYTEEGYPQSSNSGIIYAAEGVKLYECAQTEGIKAGAFCYTPSKGFYANKDWVDPNEIPDDDAVEIITGEEVISDTDAIGIITGEQQITSGQVLTIIEGGDL